MESTFTRNSLQQEMFKFVESYRQSGLTQKQFCDQKGLSLYKFKYWITKYNKLKTASFIPLHVKESQPSNSYRIDLPNGIVIHLTGSEGLILISELISHVSERSGY